jgi:hypothetical protein
MKTIVPRRSSINGKAERLANSPAQGSRVASSLAMAPCSQSDKTYIGDRARDMAKDDFASKICLYLVAQMFDPDPEKVTVSGAYEDFSDHHVIHLVLRESNGTVWNAIDYKNAPFSAIITVRPKGKVPIDKCLRRDFLTPLVQQWLAINGYPKDFPCGVSCEINRNPSGLDISLFPCY